MLINPNNRGKRESRRVAHICPVPLLLPSSFAPRGDRAAPHTMNEVCIASRVDSDRPAPNTDTGELVQKADAVIAAVAAAAAAASDARAAGAPRTHGARGERAGRWEGTGFHGGWNWQPVDPKDLVDGRCNFCPLKWGHRGMCCTDSTPTPLTKRAAAQSAWLGIAAAVKKRNRFKPKTRVLVCGPGGVLRGGKITQAKHDVYSVRMDDTNELLKDLRGDALQREIEVEVEVDIDDVEDEPEVAAAAPPTVAARPVDAITMDDVEASVAARPTVAAPLVVAVPSAVAASIVAVPVESAQVLHTAQAAQLCVEAVASPTDADAKSDAPVSPPVCASQMTINRFLETARLSQYTEKMLRSGWDCLDFLLEQVQTFEDLDDLPEFPIKPAGHKHRFFVALCDVRNPASAR